MRWGRGNGGTVGGPDNMPALPPLDAPGDFHAEVRMADAARDARDWGSAAAHYRAALERDSTQAGIWVQLGHAEKEAGDAAAAEAAYRRAVTLDPRGADAHVQLGHALKLQGHRADAITAYSEAARIDPALASARRELIHLGARAALPDSATHATEMWRRTAAIAEVLAGGLAALRDDIAGSAYPLAAYDRFRRDLPVRAPPGPLPVSQGELVVLVDAVAAAPFLVRATLRSLQDQSVRDWRAIVAAPAATIAHPVGAFATTDPRIVFVKPEAALEDAAHVVSITAGTSLDAEALAWLLFAVQRTGAIVAFADHDRGVVDPALGLIRADPVLWGAYDLAMMREVAPPALVIAAGALVRAAAQGEGLRRALLTTAAAKGSVPHIARLLATCVELPIVAHDGRASNGDGVPGRLGPAPAILPPRPDVPHRPDRIVIVIPTRDAGDLLRVTIDTLRATARDAARLDIVVVDNRTSDDLTLRLFDDLAARGVARIMPCDAPFNWSLASNIGARASDAPVLLFANNDLEMRTAGWDDLLLDALADESVGAVGARLLYPDGTVQHGGMVFGLGPGGAEHEGRDRSADDTGPGDRLITMRAVAAVTGAFLALRRDVFDAIDGFDAERLMVGHSDVDLCLRVRERGLTVLYCPRIEAIHHEGATRGRNETRADIAWDEGERADLIARWGNELAEDPGVSPYWAPGGVPFDGLRDPPLRVILRHLDRSARADPWRPTRRAAQQAAMWSPERVA